MTEFLPPRLSEQADAEHRALLQAAARVDEAAGERSPSLHRLPARRIALRSAARSLAVRTRSSRRVWARPAGLVVGVAAVMAMAGLWWKPWRSPEGAAVTGVPSARVAALSAPSPESGWDLVQLAEVGTVESTRNSLELHLLTGERQLRLESGILRAQISPQPLDRPLVVVTPHLRVVVVGTRFDVFVMASTTRVEVLEGRVRVESGQASAFVGAGESLVSTDLMSEPSPAPRSPPVVPKRPATALRRASPTTVGRCASLASERDQVRCFERLAAGSDVHAEIALFTLGKRALQGGDPNRALAYWSEYQRRFPAGVLAPETALNRVEALRASGRVEEALKAAIELQRRFPDDPRALEAVRIGEEWLRAQLGPGVQLPTHDDSAGDALPHPAGRPLHQSAPPDG